MNCKEYFEWWMENLYPYAKHANALSPKWVIKFAEDYKHFKS